MSPETRCVPTKFTVNYREFWSLFLSICFKPILKQTLPWKSGGGTISVTLFQAIFQTNFALKIGGCTIFGTHFFNETSNKIKKKK